MAKPARVSGGSAGSSQEANAPRSDLKNVHNDFAVHDRIDIEQQAFRARGLRIAKITVVLRPRVVCHRDSVLRLILCSCVLVRAAAVTAKARQGRATNQDPSPRQGQARRTGARQNLLEVERRGNRSHQDRRGGAPRSAQYVNSTCISRNDDTSSVFARSRRAVSLLRRPWRKGRRPGSVQVTTMTTTTFP